MTGHRRIRLSAQAAARVPAVLTGAPRDRATPYGLGFIANHAYSGPYEDLRLKRP